MISEKSALKTIKTKIVWDVCGHELIKQFLISSINSGRLSHAFLLVGKSHLGKYHLAKELAQTILCQNEAIKPCRKCANCQIVAKESHPDLFLVKRLTDEKTGKLIVLKYFEELGPLSRALKANPSPKATTAMKKSPIVRHAGPMEFFIKVDSLHAEAFSNLHVWMILNPRVKFFDHRFCVGMARRVAKPVIIVAQRPPSTSHDDRIRPLPRDFTPTHIEFEANRTVTAGRLVYAIIRRRENLCLDTS